VPPFGSYEEYRVVLGGILEAALFPGFLASSPRLRIEADPVTAAWREFVAAWGARFSENEVRPIDLLEIAEATDMRIRGKDEKARATSLGSLLGHNRGRVFAGWKISRAGKSWTLTRTGTL
jgi:hypothetical protein